MDKYPNEYSRAKDTHAPRWRRRMEDIDSQVATIRLPDVDGEAPDQDREYCELVTLDGQTKTVRFHDYDEVYKIPGFYEGLFYEMLQCCSPSRVANLLDDVLEDFEDNPEELRVLDVGAGNGIVGDEFLARGAEKIIGVDIIPEARQAADRDRPDVYDDYIVTDLTDLPERHEENLREQNLNCLTTVAALGYGDIPPKAFLKALDLLVTPGWLAFNIKETFLDAGSDGTGFSDLVKHLNRDGVIQIQSYRRYCHRINVAGEPLHYVAVVARKLKDVPDELMEFWSHRDGEA
ncbi:MAG: methyltransferase domain-containing protein [Phycisphaerae bacterium]|nr:methyltransferase domain-containing protein [Phycisphaerae bacterium]